MRSFLSNLLVKTLVLSSALASADAASPFPTASSPISHKALLVRGGFNPLDGVDTAKTLSKIGLGAGTATALSTKTVLDKLGIGNVDPVSLLVGRRIGGAILQFAIAAYFLECQGSSASTACALAFLPSMVELSKTLFDGTPKELDFPAEGQAIVLAVSSYFFYAFLNNPSDDLFKISAGWQLLNGVFFAFFPKNAIKFWGDSGDAAPKSKKDATASLLTTQKFVSVWGFSLISTGILTGLLGTDMATTKALTYGAIPFLAKIILSKYI